MEGVTYDTGALIAAEQADSNVWRIHRQAIDRGIKPIVPAGLLAPAWRGGPQALLSRLLGACRIEDLDKERARSAGAACALAGTADIVDASVAVSAGGRGDIVVTSDHDDLARLSEALGARLRFERI